MPCRTDDHFDAKERPNSIITISQYNDLKKEADNVTRLLCSVLGKLEKEVQIDGLNIEGLSSWWENHKEVDRKRIKKEIEKVEKVFEGLSDEAREMFIKQIKNK